MLPLRCRPVSLQTFRSETITRHLPTSEPFRQSFVSDSLLFSLTCGRCVPAGELQIQEQQCELLFCLYCFNPVCR
jgi:hypothetical protein